MATGVVLSSTAWLAFRTLLCLHRPSTHTIKGTGFHLSKVHLNRALLSKVRLRPVCPSQVYLSRVHPISPRPSKSRAIWTSLSAHLPHLIVACLRLQKFPTTLQACTHQRKAHLSHPYTLPCSSNISLYRLVVSPIQTLGHNLLAYLLHHQWQWGLLHQSREEWHHMAHAWLVLPRFVPSWI